MVLTRFTVILAIIACIITNQPHEQTFGKTQSATTARDVQLTAFCHGVSQFVQFEGLSVLGDRVGYRLVSVTPKPRLYRLRVRFAHRTTVSLNGPGYFAVNYTHECTLAGRRSVHVRPVA